MYKHLSVEQRVLIEDRLNHRQSIRNIARELDVSPSTIQREITRHLITTKAHFNDCIYRKGCVRTNLCNVAYCRRHCSKCNVKCSAYCPDYEGEECPKRINGMCNGCRTFPSCQRKKTFYNAITADNTYHKTLKSAREGFDLTADEMAKINKLASPMIKNGTSPYHVKQTYGDELPVSESTLRRMIDKCELDARNIDLRDKVKRNPRRTTNNASRKQYLSASKISHFYSDYLSYIESHDVHTVEMDCVEGKQTESEALLTLTFKEFSLQLAFIIEAQDSDNVISMLDKIELSLGTELFREIFPVILTDNGSEFADVFRMEESISGGKRTKIFFCEPNRSDEKGTCENHHKMIRYFIPKGTSLRPFNQGDISLMMNHINSYKRKALFGRSAFDIAKAVLPEDFFILLGQEEIPPQDIVLSPKIFHHS